jgi:hypothetical protein
MGHKLQFLQTESFPRGHSMVEQQKVRNLRRPKVALVHPGVVDVPPDGVVLDGHDVAAAAAASAQVLPGRL